VLFCFFLACIFFFFFWFWWWLSYGGFAGVKNGEENKWEVCGLGLASVEDTFYFSLGEKESFFIRSGQAIFVRVFSK
jgi:hypothetical protein